MIRTGAERAVVAAVFESEGAAARAIESILETNGLDAENGSLILRREIAAGGKGRVFINNQPATVAVLKQIAPHLAVIHAQNESIVNFDAAARQDLLDAYAGVELKDVSAAFAHWKQIRGRIAELEQDEQDRMRLSGPVEFPVPRDRRGAAARRAKMSGWKPRSASSPMRRRSMARPSMLSICSMRATPPLRRACARRRSISRNWRVTSRSFRRRSRRWSRRASASKMWARRCAIMRAESRLRPSVWRNSKSGWRCWIG